MKCTYMILPEFHKIILVLPLLQLVLQMWKTNLPIDLGFIGCVLFYIRIANNLLPSEPENTSEKPREVSVMWLLSEALVETYNANWRVVRDYVSPGCFFYIVERLLIWASRCQGYVITSSCFTEWLMYQEEDTHLQPSITKILHFVSGVVSKCLCNRENLIEWIKKFNVDWKTCYSLLVPRLVFLLCLLCVNFGVCLDLLSDVLGKSHITEQLPWEFYDTLKRWMKNNFVKIINVNVLAIAFKKINNALVIVSFGRDCSRVLCPDTVFVDMKATQCKDDLFRKMFPKAPVIQAAQGQIGSMEAEANTLCGVLSASDIRAGKTSLNSSLVAETDIATDEQFDIDESTLKSAQPDAVSTSASATQGNKKGTRKNNPKKHKGRKGRK